jgi:hypothetical protein
MDVDRHGGVTPVFDVRRRVAFRVFGAYRFLNIVQSGLRDIDGALAAGQYTVAAIEARYMVLSCLSILSLETEGEIDDAPGALTFDYFAGLSADTIERGLTLANEGLRIDKDTAGDWHDRIRAYAADIEQRLGYEDPLPELRSAEGAFGFLGLAHHWVGAVKELNLPALLPPEWLSTST